MINQGTTYKMNLRTGQLPRASVNTKEQTLLAGPWIGEFGWELFCWQGYLRSIAPNYKKVLVASRVGHEFMYEDFSDEFVPVIIPSNAQSDSWFCRGMKPNFADTLIIGVKYDVRIPAKNIGFLMHGNGVPQKGAQFGSQNFIKFESDTLDKTFDILVHPRNRDLGGNRNWDRNKWQTLINKLSEKFNIATIGTHEAFELENTTDYRNVSVRDTVSLMNRTKLVVGQSSGPMHLASLAMTPHLVWSSPHNKDRYEKHWNPFGTPVYFYSKYEWNPPVDFIYDKIIEAL